MRHHAPSRDALHAPRWRQPSISPAVSQGLLAMRWRVCPTWNATAETEFSSIEARCLRRGVDIACFIPCARSPLSGHGGQSTSSSCARAGAGYLVADILLGVGRSHRLFPQPDGILIPDAECSSVGFSTTVRDGHQVNCNSNGLARNARRRMLGCGSYAVAQAASLIRLRNAGAEHGSLF